MKPTIIYYALLMDCTGSNITPKYRIEFEAMEYEPMTKIMGKDGFVSMYLKPNQSSKPDAPEMNLQAKSSLNFTGVKYSKYGNELDEWAYGNPLQTETYSKDNKPNPFYAYRHHCYVFRMHYDNNIQHRPVAIELFVLSGDEQDRMKQMAPTYLKTFQMGCFDNEVAALRKLANTPKQFCIM